MRKLLFCLALVVETPANALEQPWIGNWAGEGQSCALVGEIAEEMPTELTQTDEFGMEYSCEFLSVKALGVGQSWKVERKCLDAGFTEFWNVIWVLTANDELLTIDDQGNVSRQKRCEKP
jgi:hypothetical protein